MSAPRPTVTDQMIHAAIMDVAPMLESGDSSDRNIEAIADTIQRVYSHPMDGFDIALALSKFEGWNVSRSDAEEMDAIESRIRNAFMKAEKRWFEENIIELPLPIGAETTRGVIAGIYEYQPAYYKIKSVAAHKTDVFC